MRIRLHDGRYAGQVVDMRVPEAKHLLAEGRASLPDDDAAPTPEVAPPPAVLTAPQQGQWHRRRKRR